MEMLKKNIDRILLVAILFVGLIGGLGGSKASSLIGAVDYSTTDADALFTKTVTVNGNTSLGGNLTVTGTTTLSGTLSGFATSSLTTLTVSGTSTLGILNASGAVGLATSTISQLTVTGAAALNGGLTMDTNKFSVADATGNTLISGTLSVTGTSTLATSTGVWHSSDNTAGLTATCASTSVLTVKNGLITACP